MNRFAVLFVLYIVNIGVLLGEGTRELAPNDTIMINGDVTHDIAALNLDNPEYNNFASYDNPNPLNRLHIYISDPGEECIFLGFSTAELNGGAPVDFEFRIKDPAGNVIYGPIVVNPSNANTPTWEEAFNGPVSIAGPAGYIPLVVTSADLASQGNVSPGNYYIEFRNLTNSDGFLIRYWDITVANCANPGILEKKGRVWSNNWALFALNDFGFPERPFNGAFYVCSPDPANPSAAFITRVDFNGSGFRPAGFNIAFNSFGVTRTGDIAQDRMSVENDNLTSPEYEIFLNDPVDLCETASAGEIDLLALTRCSASDICINFSTTRAGQIDVLLDFDGNDGLFTPGTADRLIAQMVNPGQVNTPTCLDWDGLDGLGNDVSAMPDVQIPIVMSYAQGIYHFPIYDAELLTEGLKIERVRPNGSSPLLYYDDSNITAPNGTGEATIQLSGCIAPCHKWTTYTGPRDVGFGNLNTINTWWFSQQVLTEAILTLPGIPECTIIGMDSLCAGDSATVSADFNTIPNGSQNIDVTELQWTGPNIISDPTQETITIVGGGLYTLDYQWSTYPGDTCTGTCTVDIFEGGIKDIRIDTLIVSGDTIKIYGEDYFAPGEYRQIRPSQTGCDTLIIINIRTQEAVIQYELDDCRSFPWDRSNQNYEEFQPNYLKTLDCAELIASNIFRENPDANMHSCSYGINGSIAMCVSSLDTCNYIAGSDKAIVFEISVEPDPDTSVVISGISFWERAPEMFKWVLGDSGPNNYPTLFGVRVLKNDSVIYELTDLPTTEDWTEEVFNFDTIPAFTSTESSTFRFELLPYCLVGNGAAMDAWDIDEVLVFANCEIPNTIVRPNIGGLIVDAHDEPVNNARVNIRSMENSGYTSQAFTNDKGKYMLPSNPDREQMEITARYDDDPINGVSVRDILDILRHLRGRRVISDPVRLLAADVNMSQSISIGDASEIARVILGRQPKFRNKPSWQLGAPAELLLEEGPWSFYNQRYIQLTGSDRMTEDWLAIKTGDVNLSATPQYGQNRPRGQSMILSTDEKWIEEGEELTLAITLTDNSSLNGLQLALDLSGFKLVDHGSSIIDLETYTHHSETDEYAVAWYSLDPVELSQGTILLELTLVSDQSGFLSDLMRINEDRIVTEAIDEDDMSSSINLTFNDRDKVFENSDLVRTYPNPFSDQLTFVLAPEITGNMVIELLDINGRICYSQKSEVGQDGRIVINHDHGDCPSSTLLYTLTTDDHHLTGKVVKK